MADYETFDGVMERIGRYPTKSKIKLPKPIIWDLDKIEWKGSLERKSVPFWEEGCKAEGRKYKFGRREKSA